MFSTLLFYPHVITSLKTLPLYFLLPWNNVTHETRKFNISGITSFAYHPKMGALIFNNCASNSLTRQWCCKKGVEMEQIYSQVFWESQGNSLCVVLKEVQGWTMAGAILETSWGARSPKSHHWVPWKKFSWINYGIIYTLFSAIFKMQC